MENEIVVLQRPRSNILDVLILNYVKRIVEDYKLQMRLIYRRIISRLIQNWKRNRRPE